MDPRFAWLDALIALGLGRELYKLGDSFDGVHLPGAPQAVLVFEDLQRHGWIAPRDKQGRRYVLTDAGRTALAEGAAWYRRLPVWRRVLNVRPALPLAERALEAGGHRPPV